MLLPLPLYRRETRYSHHVPSHRIGYHRYHLQMRTAIPLDFLLTSTRSWRVCTTTWPKSFFLGQAVPESKCLEIPRLRVDVPILI